MGVLSARFNFKQSGNPSVMNLHNKYNYGYWSHKGNTPHIHTGYVMKPWNFVVLTRQVPPFRHGWAAQSSMLTSQLAPVNPTTQAHLYPFSISWKDQSLDQFFIVICVTLCTVQEPPLVQGLLAHSSISSWQVIPVYPGGQTQMYPPLPLLMQVASFRQGACLWHGMVSGEGGREGNSFITG